MATKTTILDSSSIPDALPSRDRMKQAIIDNFNKVGNDDDQLLEAPDGDFQGRRWRQSDIEATSGFVNLATIVFLGGIGHTVGLSYDILSDLKDAEVPTKQTVIDSIFDESTVRGTLLEIPGGGKVFPDVIREGNYADLAKFALEQDIDVPSLNQASLKEIEKHVGRKGDSSRLFGDRGQEDEEPDPGGPGFGPGPDADDLRERLRENVPAIEEGTFEFNEQFISSSLLDDIDYPKLLDIAKEAEKRGNNIPGFTLDEGDTGNVDDDTGDPDDDPKTDPPSDSGDDTESTVPQLENISDDLGSVEEAILKLNNTVVNIADHLSNINKKLITSNEKQTNIANQLSNINDRLTRLNKLTKGSWKTQREMETELHRIELELGEDPENQAAFDAAMERSGRVESVQEKIENPIDWSTGNGDNE